METIIFDGRAFAREREVMLKKEVENLGIAPRILSVVFEEDEESLKYVDLKKQVAVRVGIEFDEEVLSVHQSIKEVSNRVKHSCKREDVQGVLIQKPTRRVWQEAIGGKWKSTFSSWWNMVTANLCEAKDVDCLSKVSLGAVYSGEWKILPAAVKAVVLIIDQALGANLLVDRGGLGSKKVVVVGKSELVGRPLAAVLEQFEGGVHNCGIKTEDLAAYTREADILVSATGRPGLIEAEMVKEGIVVVDVGSPKGDVDFESVKEKASFITPVPGGVGPVTVVSLLENLLELVGR